MKIYIWAKAKILYKSIKYCILPHNHHLMKIMSTIVQLQRDKCECPNWSIGPE